jgi:hypothetical protein
VPSAPEGRDLPIRRSTDEPASRPYVVEALETRFARPTVFEAMREFWWVILLACLVGVGCGTAYGLLRKPTYTAEARLSVGRVDVATQSIPGFTTAALTLADSYSRAIDARAVVRDTAKTSGMKPARVTSDVSASPIPQSPLVRVFATASQGGRAVTLANDASHALINYVQTLNRFNPDSKSLLQRFRSASLAYNRAVAERASAPSASAQSNVDSTRLQMQTAGQLYQASQAGQSSPNTLQVLALATSAGSDFSSSLQRAIFAGLVAGFLISAGAALFLANRF